MFVALNRLMILNFREWFEARHAAVIHPEVGKWLASADKLKQTIEKLKSVLKDKEAKEKTKPPVKVPVEKKPEIKEKEPEKPEKPEEKIEKEKVVKKVIKPEVEPKKDIKKPDMAKIEPKIIEKSTKVEKAKEHLRRNERRPEF